ncbi:MAG TPA: HAMP domain-containing sensor histidine kinase [Thermoflexus sp.]|nr:HAMP domain-containing sensor histidine kinase [Thermoflexus sp.]
MERRWFFWLTLAGMSLIAALGVTAGLQQGVAPNPVFRLQVRADLGTWILIVSTVLASCLVLVVAGYYGVRYLLQRSFANAQRELLLTKLRFIRRLDHELKNHLAAIRAQLTYLSGEAERESLKQVLNDIQAQVERMARLMTDLRKLAELEEQDIERLPVDVAALLKEVVEASRVHPNYETRRVHLLLPQAPWPLPAVKGDPDLLWLAVFNVLDNALKFTRPGDLIELRAFEDGRSVVIEVADTGPGIAKEDLPHIFEELYRGANAQRCEGSGLGLALVQTIIRRHGGSVRVRSRPGEGTVFTISLPLTS